MTDQQNTAPAVWDPTARGGAGGWVRNPQRQDAEPAPPAQGAQPAAPAPGAQPPKPGPVAPPPSPGAVGDQGPPLGARPYLATAPGFGPPASGPEAAPGFGPPVPGFGPPPADAAPAQGHGAPTAAFPAVAPPPPAAAPFPSHATPQTRGPQGAPTTPGPGYVYPPPPPAAAPAQPPYGAQPDYPTHYPVDDEDDRPRPGKGKAPLLIGFALLLVLAVGGGLLYASQGGDDKSGQAAPAPTAAGSGNPQPAPAPTGTDAAPSTAPTTPAGGTPSPSATGPGPGAQAQAQALDGLLSEGENARAQIGNAVAKVNSCPAKADIESAAQVFDSGAKQRDGLVTKLSKLSVTDLPGGADAVNSLKSAWQLSADIDRSYASWARAVAGQGCSDKAPTTADKKHADELNPQATQAKNDFLTKWKPIATAYGLTPPTSDRI
ncbi:hypothetical protein ABZW30_27845 [Kitasatospora sp. NPDC004669]|uniref:hypothetical protein n=1 Tax=Kitasatospora sp. NPDC004669 TaxID=3154555 RepID=UPI0033AC4B7F